MAEVLKEITEQRVIVRLLRCSRTRRYFTGRGWSEDVAEAKVYWSDVAAVRTCVEQDLEDVELVLRLSGADTDMCSIAIR